MQFIFPTIDGPMMIRAREAFAMIQRVIEDDKSPEKILKGIDPVFALSVLANETRVGGNLGGKASTATMKESERKALAEIIAKLEGKASVDQATIDKYPVSQGGGGQYGGAMGLMQIMPVTWADVQDKIPKILGIAGAANPWVPAHSLAGGMAYLVLRCGANSDQELATRKYIAGPNGNLYGTAANGYASEVMGYKVCFQKAIDLGCFKPDAEQTDEIKKKCKQDCSKL
jgi:hypothetical protein